VDVALVTWQSVKEMVFEGGPHPWILEPSRFFLELSMEKAEAIRVAEVRLPAKRKQNQYVYRVLCLELGEQVRKQPFSVISMTLQPVIFFVFVVGLVWFWFWFFRDRVSLYSPGCPGTHFVDQAGLELRNPPASNSQVLGLKACTTMPGCKCVFFHTCVGTHVKVPVQPKIDMGVNSSITAYLIY
jgi:hypothetical protein